MNARPDFVIAGAPKCGTTALFEYLRRQPRIFIPHLKEPKFFCSDLKTTGGVYTLDGYRALFAGAHANIVTGEASTFYLYSRVAIEKIMAHNPRTKVIAILRNPVEAAHSLHAARWSHRHENVRSFEQAWRIQSARLAGEQMPTGWPDPATLQYGPMYCYAGQIRRMFEHVPPGQRYIIVYEEFFADPVRHFAKLLQFLEVPADTHSDFTVVNPALGHRSAGLDRLLRQPPRWVRKLYGSMRPLFTAARMSPARLAWHLNTVPRRKPVLDAAFRAQMERYFAPDIAELESLLGRLLWR
ncbi:MAG: sulfotransferase domain-containing protein [Proteobacteria bacterium]|nr:sulfotransferase domain-containing protein [Pseudomonadota bacterium]